MEWAVVLVLVLVLLRHVLREGKEQDDEDY